MSRFSGGLLRLNCNDSGYKGILFDERVCPLCKGGILNRELFFSLSV